MSAASAGRRSMGEREKGLRDQSFEGYFFLSESGDSTYTSWNKLPVPFGSIPTMCCFSLVPALNSISPGLGLSSSQVSFFEDSLSSLSPVCEEAVLQSSTVPYLARAFL